MFNTNRYAGLKHLERNGLPIPLFLKVTHPGVLGDPFFKTKAPWGWTIRTCKSDGRREFNLYSRNNLGADELARILKYRLGHSLGEYYLVYKSWSFRFSFNILKTESGYIIEGKKGSQKKISAGRENPGFRLEADLFTLKVDPVGLRLIDTPSLRKIRRALRLLRKNITDPFFYTEVAVTTTGELLFYEFWGSGELRL